MNNKLYLRKLETKKVDKHRKVKIILVIMSIYALIVALTVLVVRIYIIN